MPASASQVPTAAWRKPALALPAWARRPVRPSLAGAAAGLLAAILAMYVPATAAAQQGPPPVDVAQPLSDEVIDHDIYTGRFEAVQEVELRARVSGYLDKVTFQDGDIVEKGALLFVIDQATFQTAVERATANLAAAEASRDLAKVENERAEQLVRRNVGTRQEVDRTRAALAESEAAVLVAKAELRQVEQDLGFTEIRAPFRGRMSNRKIDPGNLVIGGAGNATVLSTIVSIDPIHFVFTASEADYLRYIRMVKNGELASARDQEVPIAVRLMDEQDFEHDGTLDFVDNTLNPNSGTINLRAVLPNPDGFLTPGVFGRLRLPGSRPYDALLVPDEAILSDQARKIVMTVAEDGTVTPKRVELGDLHKGLRIIRSGISKTDRVVIAGVQRARPGAPVSPTTVELTLQEE